MNFIRIFFVLLFFYSHIRRSKQIEPDFCSGTQEVDAASFSTIDRRNLLLFSGAYYWELDVDTKRIIRSHKIREKFPEIEDNLDAACGVSSLDEAGYMFLKGDKAWTYTGKTNPKFDLSINWKEFAANYSIQFDSDHAGIGCVACYCHDPENCHVILVDKGTVKKSYGCLFNYGESLTKCQLYNYIQMPERIKENLLKDIDGCYGLTYAMDPEQPTMVVAVDKTNVYYFQNNKQIYATSLTEIFGCWTLSTADANVLIYAVLGAFIFMLILCVCIIIIWRIRVANRDTSSPLLREGIEVEKTTGKAEAIKMKTLIGKTGVKIKEVAKPKK